ncbi:hypothetical protein R3P38DRAFT_3189809 [Favolaschia claudopus]|uniref:Uncharacterized protein n=1 Tax=Favolaschia claudopus TaxID=2862362 RepID=A0AAW0BPI1_9AGAR
MPLPSSNSRYKFKLPADNLLPPSPATAEDRLKQIEQLLFALCYRVEDFINLPHEKLTDPLDPVVRNFLHGVLNLLPRQLTPHCINDAMLNLIESLHSQIRVGTANRFAVRELVNPGADASKQMAIVIDGKPTDRIVPLQYTHNGNAHSLRKDFELVQDVLPVSGMPGSTAEFIPDEKPVLQPEVKKSEVEVKPTLAELEPVILEILPQGAAEVEEAPSSSQTQPDSQPLPWQYEQPVPTKLVKQLEPPEAPSSSQTQPDSQPLFQNEQPVSTKLAKQLEPPEASPSTQTQPDSQPLPQHQQPIAELLKPPFTSSSTQTQPDTQVAEPPDARLVSTNLARQLKAPTRETTKNADGATAEAVEAHHSSPTRTRQGPTNFRALMSPKHPIKSKPVDTTWFSLEPKREPSPPSTPERRPSSPLKGKVRFFDDAMSDTTVEAKRSPTTPFIRARVSSPSRVRATDGVLDAPAFIGDKTVNRTVSRKRVCPTEDVDFEEEAPMKKRKKASGSKPRTPKKKTGA